MDINLLIKNPVIVEFISVFARLEYSLKASGYFKNEEEAKPDWNSYANSIEKVINKSNDSLLDKSIKDILNNPPKKQIIKNGSIKWSDSPANQGSYVKNLLIYIRRIRNNLFHGGKFVGGHLSDFDKDLCFVKNALNIINKIIRRSSRIC